MSLLKVFSLPCKWAFIYDMQRGYEQWAPEIPLIAGDQGKKSGLKSHPLRNWYQFLHQSTMVHIHSVVKIAAG